MSLELVELPRIKVSPEVHALLSAEAELTGDDINKVVREWLHARADVEMNKLRVANRHLKSRGFPCIDVSERREFDLRSRLAAEK